MPVNYLAVLLAVVAVAFAGYGLHVSYSSIELLKVTGAESYNFISIVLVFRGCAWMLAGVIAAIFAATLTVKDALARQVKRP
jgi:hypothetical protein